MNKKTKLYLGIGAVAVAGYFIWLKSKQTTTPKANFQGPCPAGQDYMGITQDRSKILCVTKDGGRNYISIKYSGDSVAKDSTNKR